MFTQTEENYLKALYHIGKENNHKEGVGTNELAAHLAVKPATANDMLKKLKEKNLVTYEKYGKIFLSEAGKRIAIEIIRKHRLWETFLYEKLAFSWDEVHEVAEQLEHIQSTKLIEQLDKFLGYPEVDPHGDPIPDALGRMKQIKRQTLDKIPVGRTCKLVAVKDSSASFLKYALRLGLGLSSQITIVQKIAFDSSLEIEINGIRSTVSQKFAENLFVI